jgi:phosphatidylglycerophosphate synthase
MLETVKEVGAKALYYLDEVCAFIMVAMSLVLFTSMIAGTVYLVVLGASWLPNTLVFVLVGLIIAACLRAAYVMWQDLHEYQIATVVNLAIATFFSGIAYVSDRVRALIERMNQ